MISINKYNDLNDHNKHLQQIITEAMTEVYGKRRT